MIGSNPRAEVYPQTLSADRRGFTDQHGRPFFWLGDTAWPLFSQYRRAEAEAYFANRAEKGFTVIQGVIAWPGDERPARYGMWPNEAGAYPWLDGDPARPNPHFFAHVDAVLDVARRHGLTIGILPTWGNFVTDTHTLNAENARIYGHWLGVRYRERPNLVWINGGDCLPHGYEAVFDALAEGLRHGDGGAHLITYHPCALHSAAQFFGNRGWLDFSMTQTWTDWHKTYDSLISDALTVPARPVVLGEGAYENGPEYARGPITPLVVRRQVWWTFAAGGYFTYGQDQMWRAQQGWANTFDTPGAIQMSTVRDIVASLPWWERVPDQTLIEEGMGSGETLNSAVRGRDGRWALVYLSSRCHVLIRLERLASEYVRATWVNPATGQRLDAGTHRAFTLLGFRQVRQSCFEWFRTPDFWEDAVLILQAAEA